MSCVVGLGNPGERYEGTRHNLGFQVVDELLRRHQLPLDRELCGSLVGRHGDLGLVKPLTYMNRSGYAVRCLLERSEMDPSEVLIVYDDVNLDFGRLRMRPDGNPSGHRGMESVVQNLRTTAVPRLRLGIGAAPDDCELTDFVLSPFRDDEEEGAERMIQHAADAADAWLVEGVESAMNKYNGPEIGGKTGGS